MKKPLHVGLTGGIGSGKTTVSNIFAELGVPVIDADVIARQVVKAGQPAFEKIVNFFGETILDENGELNRSEMRKLVFNDSEARTRLESFTHPEIQAEMSRLSEQVSYPYCIISSPLLLESRAAHKLDKILVIDLPESEQIQRASMRDRSNPADIKKIVRSQLDRETRLKFADDIIRNDTDLSNLREQVENIHMKYLAIAESGTHPEN